MRSFMLLYAIADRLSLTADHQRSASRLVDLSADWASRGVDFIQIRDKFSTHGDLLALAARIVEAARQTMSGTRGSGTRGSGAKVSGTRILVNAALNISASVALESGADGVHIPGGSSPGQLAETIAHIHAQWASRGRSINGSAGDMPVISVACHAVSDVQAARKAGATLALFAPVFEKALPGEPGLPGKGLEALAEACRAGRKDEAQSELPILALGGVTLANAARCIAAGADGIAAIRLFMEEDANSDRDWRSLKELGSSSGLSGVKRR